MGLDYTDGCVNFRDTGEFINLIAGKQFIQEGKLFRGGTIDYVKRHDEIALVKSIISLRNGPDPKSFEADYYHFPMSNKIEKYDTSQKEVRIWLNQIMSVFQGDDFKFPFLIHCLSGKDRTGIVIATLLRILRIDQKIIMEEYLLSEGEVKSQWLQLALDGINDPKKYFNRVDLDLIQANLKKHLLAK